MLNDVQRKTFPLFNISNYHKYSINHWIILVNFFLFLLAISIAELAVSHTNSFLESLILFSMIFFAFDLWKHENSFLSICIASFLNQERRQRKFSNSKEVINSVKIKFILQKKWHSFPLQRSKGKAVFTVI